MSKENNTGSDWAKYSAVGIQFLLIIGLFTFGGIKLDEYLGMEKPLFTAGLAIFGVIVSMVYMIKSFGNINKK